MRITPDLVQWILAEDKVTTKWRSIARRLGLSRYITDIEIGGSRDGGGKNGGWERRSRTARGRALRGDSHKLQALLEVWEETAPETFTVKNLKNILAAEGLHDMWIWVNMMTQSSPLKHQVSDVVYRNITASPASSPHSNYHTPSSSSYSYHASPFSQHRYHIGSGNNAAGPLSPNSSYLPSPRSTTTTTTGQPSAGPYSTFFQRSESPEPSTSSYLSSLDSYSRPNSQLSDYYLAEYLPKLQNPPVRGAAVALAAGGGGTSCPATPLCARRSMSPLLAASPAPSSSSYTPGWGAKRRNSCSTYSSACDTGKKNVYSLLYRPDLIQLSSPRYRMARTNSAGGRLDGGGSNITSPLPGRRQNGVGGGISNPGSPLLGQRYNGVGSGSSNTASPPLHRRHNGVDIGIKSPLANRPNGGGGSSASSNNGSPLVRRRQAKLNGAAAIHSAIGPDYGDPSDLFEDIRALVNGHTDSADTQQQQTEQLQKQAVGSLQSPQPPSSGLLKAAAQRNVQSDSRDESGHWQEETSRNQMPSHRGDGRPSVSVGSGRTTAAKLQPNNVHINNNNNNRHVVNFSIERRKRIELNSLAPIAAVDTEAVASCGLQPLLLEFGGGGASNSSSGVGSTSSGTSNSNRGPLLLTESPRKGGRNSYQEYFDNLISLIDEAARELSV